MGDTNATKGATCRSEVKRMNKPSSTITAATLAGMGITAAWALVDNFTALSVSATVVSTTSLFGMSAAGYFKRENVLPIKRSIK